MPPKYSKQRKYRKKPLAHKRKYKKGNQVTHMTSRSLIVPDRFMTKLRYIDTDSPTLLIPSSSNVSNQITYVSNGLYDANTLLGSTAIPGFTEIIGLYNNYRVLASKITVTFCNTTIYPVTAYVIAASGQTTVPTTWVAIRHMEGNAYCKEVALDPQNGGHMQKKVVMYINHSKLTSNPQYKTDIAYQGNAIANPSLTTRYFVGAITSTSGVVPSSQTIVMTSKVEFYCEFYNRESNLQG